MNLTSVVALLLMIGFTALLTTLSLTALRGRIHKVSITKLFTDPREFAYQNLAVDGMAELIGRFSWKEPYSSSQKDGGTERYVNVYLLFEASHPHNQPAYSWHRILVYALSEVTPDTTIQLVGHWIPYYGNLACVLGEIPLDMQERIGRAIDVRHILYVDQ